MWPECAMFLASFCHPRPPIHRLACTSEVWCPCCPLGSDSDSKKTLHAGLLGAPQCQHGKTNPICKVDVVLHDLQCAVHGDVV